MERYKKYGYLFILPAMLIVFITLGYPMVNGIRLSFFEVAVNFHEKFVGLENYVKIFQYNRFWNSLKNTLIFTFISVFFIFVSGLSMSLLLNLKYVKHRTFWRAVFLTPWTISFVAAGLGWKWIYDIMYGVLNDFLLRIGMINQPVLWLADKNIAILSVIIAYVWKSFPFMMVILLAGLQTIPKSQYEAASVDGASWWNSFLYITIPNLRYSIFVGITLSFVWAIRQFDIVHVMTHGGPGNATEVLTNLVTDQAFSFFDFGGAATTSTLMLFISLVFVIIYMRLLEGFSKGNG